MPKFKIHFLKNHGGTLEIEADSIDAALAALDRLTWSELPIEWKAGGDDGDIELDRYTFTDPKNQPIQ